MSFRFRTFRRVLLGLIIFLCCVSVGLNMAILPYLNHRQMFWMIVCIQSACLLRSLWSALRKPLWNHPQSVATETVSLFVLLPFELVLTLIAAASPLERERTSNPLPLVLQIFVLANTIINLTYTACLLLVALITSAAFDSDIWIRDMDSAPSPFPLRVLGNYVFSRLVRRPPSPTTKQGVFLEAHEICLPGCQCTRKPHPNTSPDVGVSPVTQGRPISLSRSLVRVPDAVEQRSSIAVVFEV